MRNGSELVLLVLGHKTDIFFSVYRTVPTITVSNLRLLHGQLWDGDTAVQCDGGCIVSGSKLPLQDEGLIRLRRLEPSISGLISSRDQSLVIIMIMHPSHSLPPTLAEIHTHASQGQGSGEPCYILDGRQ